ncbi:hypothetical protein PENSPDRAFT_694595 [Peniophora sp. CONT]|nr:hypothetical protein PENSPDRAFT_694595 [Peniophora sp. CONT]
MSLPVLNTTQQAQVLEVLFKSTASSVAPLLLLESFILGVFCAYVPLASYVLWVNLKLTSVPRAPSIAVLWISLVAIIMHWALSLRQFESTLAGSSLEIPLTFSDLLFVVTNARDRDAATLSAYRNIASSYFNYGVAWQAFLPLITETALLGFASALFAVIAYIGFWQSCSQRRSSFALFIPAMASLMYTFSLLHWIVSLPNFTLHAANAGGGPAIPADFVFAISVTLLILLSFNAVMSDSIVLWRMCVVWDRARPAVIFAATVLVTTLALNIANIVVIAAGLRAGKFDDATVNSKDTEFITTYGGTTIGLAAAFISLASNLCATILGSVKYCTQNTSAQARLVVRWWNVLWSF